MLVLLAPLAFPLRTNNTTLKIKIASKIKMQAKLFNHP